MDQSKLPPQFAEVYQRYLSLTKAHDSGIIDHATYQKELQTLVLTDHLGQYWWLRGDGAWFRSNGETWIPRDPPAYVENPVPPPIIREQPLPPPISTGSIQPPPIPSSSVQPPPINYQSHPKKKKTYLIVLIPILAVLCLIVVAAGVSSLRRGVQEFSPQITTVEIENSQEKNSNQPSQSGVTGSASLVTLSAQQQFLVEDLGWPDAFTITEVESGEGDRVRVEIWQYYKNNSSFIFADGEFRKDEKVDAMYTDFISTPHHPDQFPLGASPEQIQALLTGHNLEKIEESSAIMDDVQFYVCQQLILSFYNDSLFNVEALAFAPDGGD